MVYDRSDRVNGGFTTSLGSNPNLGAWKRILEKLYDTVSQSSKQDGVVLCRRQKTSAFMQKALDP